MTYKEVSNIVIDTNYAKILAEASRRSPDLPDLSFESAITKAKASVQHKLPKEAELNEVQARAVEYYRRRIYDSWSVLRASKVIVKADSKRFRYNSEILEPRAKTDADDD